MFNPNNYCFLKPLGQWLLLIFAHICMTPLGLAQSVDESQQNTDKVETTIEHVVVKSKQNDYSILRDSAKAVDLIDTEFAQKMTADIGEGMARAPGISVRKNGGLGSQMRFSLNGLTGNKVRFFVDGLPLEVSGYRAGISNIPVNLVEHVEVYQGVVPVEFGADALGGAVNLVTDKKVDSIGSISQQVGSFGTRRSTVSLNYTNDNFFSRVNAYSDKSDNDYDIDVMVPRGEGDLTQVEARVRRFHDGYKANGLILDAGITQQNWADLFQVSIYGFDMDKDIQHNVNMTVPYGEMTFGRKSQGLNLRYEHSITEQLNLSAALGKSITDSHFVDVADYQYNWFGEAHFDLAEGYAEVNRDTDIIVSDSDYFVRINLDWQIRPNHNLKFLLAPTWHKRAGQNLLVEEKVFDEATAESELLYLISGIEHSSTFLDERLKNILFVKHYQIDVDAEYYPGTGAEFSKYEEQKSRWGWGNALRYNLGKYSFLKLSYENATRLPSSQELLGTGISEPNVELQPETSHNYNLSYSLGNFPTTIGAFRTNVTVFLRDIDDLIQWSPVAGRDSRNPEGTYQNISSVTSEGVQGGFGWTSVESFMSTNVNTTWMDYYNSSTGNRIANEPYFYANAGIRLNWFDTLSDADTLTLNWHTRFVEQFSIVPEDVGVLTERLLVPSQLSHALGISYSTDISDYTLNFSLEALNLTDEKLYDFKGVQKPGRSYNAKFVLTF